MTLIASKIRFLLLVPIFILQTSTFVQAQEYEEVSYEELVNRLNKKKANLTEQQDSFFDDLKLHAGLSLMSSSITFLKNTQAQQLQMNGFQLSFGVDLFSNNWVSETAIRNYGSQTNGLQNYNFREIDLKVFFRQPSENGNVGFRAGAGLTTEYFYYSDSDFKVDESVPATIFFTGLEMGISKNFALGLELGYRAALSNTASNRSIWDAGIRLDSFF